MNTFKDNILLFGMTLFVGCMLTLSSCSDDDDNEKKEDVTSPDTSNDGEDNKDEGNEPNSPDVVSPFAKDFLLTSIERKEYEDEWVFMYDEQLRLVSANETDFYGNEPILSIDYKTGIMTYYDAEDMSVSFNSKGYVTKMSGTWDYKEGGYRYCGYITYINRYENNHIVSIESTYKDCEIDKDGVVLYNEKDVSNFVYTWNNGNLIKVEWSEEDYGSRGDEDLIIKRSNRVISIFEYSDRINKYQQFPCVITADDILFFVGMYGVGPEKLPSAYTFTEIREEDGKKDEYQDSYSIEYILNENGSINTETLTNYKDGSKSINKFDYASVDGYTPEKARASYSPYMSKTKTVGKGKRIRNLLKGRLIKPMRCR